MEINIIKAIQNLSTPFWDLFFKAVTHLGSFVLVAIVFLFFYYAVNKKYAFSFLLASCTSIALNFGLKNIVQRHRPYMESGAIIKKSSSTGFSFASGHSVTISSGASGVYLRYKNEKFSSIILLVSGILALLVGYSRMYLGHHYLTDVIAGLFIGSVLTTILIILFQHIKKEEVISLILAIGSAIVALFFFKKWFIIDIDAFEYFQVCGMLAGVGLGYYLEKRFVKYNPALTKIKKRIWLTAIGFVVFGVLYFLITLVPKYNLLIFELYAMLGFYCTFVYSLIMSKIVKAG